MLCSVPAECRKIPQKVMCNAACVLRGRYEVGSKASTKDQNAAESSEQMVYSTFAETCACHKNKHRRQLTMKDLL
jgi:hypothetical protein